MSLPRLLAVIATLALLGGVFWQHRTVQRLESERAALEKQVAEQRSQVVEATSVSDPEAEARLLRERGELMRLRAEVTQLKDQLARAGQKPAAAPATVAAPPNPTPTDTLPFRSFTTTLSRNIPQGQTLLTGGWRTKEGKRTMMFITPSVVDAAGNNSAVGSSVVVSSHLVEVPESWLNDPAAGFTHNPADDTYSSAISTPSFKEFFERLKEGEGVKILANPRVITTSGQEASISIGSSAQVGDQVYHLGPQIQLTPRIAADQSIDLDLNASLTIENPVATAVP